MARPLPVSIKSVSKRQKTRCIVRQSKQGGTDQSARRQAFADDQEVAILEDLLQRASERTFMTKGELPNEVEHFSGTGLTDGSVNRFLIRH
jgi:hypothetical protein